MADNWHCEYLHHRGVEDSVIKQRGARLVYSGKPNADIPESFSSYYAEGWSKEYGLLLPYRGMLGQQYYMLRRTPGSEGDGPKFLTPKGQQNSLMLPPDDSLNADTLKCGEARQDDGTYAPVYYIVEGLTRVDALWSRGIPSLGINGIWGWRTRNAPVADFEALPLRGSCFVIWPDADASPNSRVYTAVKRLSGMLEARGALGVRVGMVPAANDTHRGLDDWLATMPPDPPPGELEQALADATISLSELATVFAHSAQLREMDAPGIWRNGGALQTSTPLDDLYRLVAVAGKSLLVADNGDAAPELFALDDYGIWRQGGALVNLLLQTSRWQLEDIDFSVKGAAAHVERARSWQHPTKKRAELESVLWGILSKDHQERKRFEDAGVTFIHASEMDSRMQYLGTASGVVDIRTRRLVEKREDARKLYISASVQYEYNPDATHNDVDKVLPLIPASAEMEWFYKALPCFMMRSPRRELVAMLTKPGSGKSVLRTHFREAMKPYVSIVRKELFEKQHSNGSMSHNTDIKYLCSPVRLAFASEIGGADPEKLNQYSGGEGEIVYRDVAEKAATGVITSHLVLQGNIPEEDSKRGFLGLKGADTDPDSPAAALKERLRVLPLPPPEERDETLLDIPSGDDKEVWGSAFLARVVAITHREYMAIPEADRERLPMPVSIQSMEDALKVRVKHEQDGWLNDIESRLVKKDKAMLHRFAAMEAMNEWFTANAPNEKQRPQPKRVTRLVGQLVAILTGRSELSGSTSNRHWIGVELKPVGHDEPGEYDQHESAERQADTEAEASAKADLETERRRQEEARAAEEPTLVDLPPCSEQWLDKLLAGGKSYYKYCPIHDVTWWPHAYPTGRPTCRANKGGDA